MKKSLKVFMMNFNPKNKFP